MRVQVSVLGFDHASKAHCLMWRMLLQVLKRCGVVIVRMVCVVEFVQMQQQHALQNP
jgi:hypothetical protein